MLMGFVLWTLVYTTEALAGDQAQHNGEPKHHANPSRQPASIAAAMSSIPVPYQATTLPETPSYSVQEFRPRGPSLNEAKGAPVAGAPSLMNDTTVWQRLSDYRTHDRLRLVTLWETGGNSLSLQAGRRGDPTLQWTSRLMSRPGDGRGLLDELFSTSVGGIGRNLHFSHVAAADGPGKGGKIMDLGLGAAASK